MEEKLLIRVAVCRYETASMLMLFAAEALSMLISLVGVLLICVGHALKWIQQQAAAAWFVQVWWQVWCWIWGCSGTSDQEGRGLCCVDSACSFFGAPSSF